MAFDVGKIRAAYPALADGHAYLDGAAGTQLPSPVIDAIAGAQAAGLGNSGGAVRAGLVHCNDRSDVDRLLAAVAELG
jgi:selenocysteine lyase/cysteine desulfurase